MSLLYLQIFNWWGVHLFTYFNFVGKTLKRRANVISTEENVISTEENVISTEDAAPPLQKVLFYF